ncbi:hypothetical protein [Lacihabitans soyangensis]|jgi:hypothetical protein|uniref:Uncharacterized protein n=1 Tax=Lacihabitans soyangensis TaxID=869394 RepID=A0AAE3H338_9BACT|nr:hypothetical protein [Lacihabitans soyangensis]MCP9763893.1 hypothetical protein [Lacihabitans soyangensis]
MENLSFEEFLASKKIDYARFLKAEPIMFSQWKHEFAQIHPDSFVMQKKFLINSIRRKFNLVVSS